MTDRVEAAAKALVDADMAITHEQRSTTPINVARLLVVPVLAAADAATLASAEGVVRELLAINTQWQPHEGIARTLQQAATTIQALSAEAERLRAVVSFVETWVCNPVGAYSVAALDGLFGMTRDRIALLQPGTGERS